MVWFGSNGEFRIVTSATEKDWWVCLTVSEPCILVPVVAE